MTINQKIKILISFLKTNYKDASCSLKYKKNYELLIATRLSAQCTDERVNKVTNVLFKQYKTIEEFANAKKENIAKIIYPCGLYKKKSEDIVEICKKLLKNFNGYLPNNLSDLLSLKGIGRKTANLILNDIFKKPSIIVDTHLIRITNKLGIVSCKNPKKIEMQLLKNIPEEEISKFSHRIVAFGKNICKAKKPNCENCKLINICNNKTKQIKNTITYKK